MASKAKTTFDGIEQELKRAEDILGRAEPRFKAITDAITRIGKLLFGLLKWALPVIVAGVPPFLFHLNGSIKRANAPILYGMLGAAGVVIWIVTLIVGLANWPDHDGRDIELAYSAEWLICLVFSILTVVVAYVPGP